MSQRKRFIFPSVLQEGETALYQAIENGHEECALTLLKAGCEPNVFMVRKEMHAIFKSPPFLLNPSSAAINLCINECLDFFLGQIQCSPSGFRERRDKFCPAPLGVQSQYKCKESGNKAVCFIHP